MQFMICKILLFALPAVKFQTTNNNNLEKKTNKKKKTRAPFVSCMHTYVCETQRRYEKKVYTNITKEKNW